MRLVKLGIANVNATVGAVRSNTDRCIAQARALAAEGVTVAAFPEQVIGGYAAEDLVQWRGFVASQWDELGRFAKETAPLATVFGSCLRVRQWWGGNFLLVARRGAAAPDPTRFVGAKIDARLGRREDVEEWDRLVAHAAWIPDHAAVVLPDPSRPVLTDDWSPLERMTDRFVERAEAEMLGR